MIEKMLRDKIGLSYDSVGRKNIEGAICTHMRKLGIDKIEDYVKAISGSEERFEELTQALVVPETWFFRYGESFAFLTGHAGKAIAEHGRLRVLSIPCSSGEEPYSIAISLLSSGIRPELIHIDAVDISKPLLEKARHGVYGPNSLRSGIPETVKHFFIAKDKSLEVVKSVKDLVNFHNFSIFDMSLIVGREPYDMIFCRNLLIYFSDEMQEEAIKILSGLLVDSGILFLGHSEFSVAKRMEFESVNFPSSFAFRKRGSVRDRKKGGQAGKPAPELKSINSPVAKINPPESRLKKLPPEEGHYEVKPASDISAMLEKAAVFADLGKLHEAEMLCLQYLEHDKLNPSAYYILGVARLSLNRMEEAAKAFSRALYLNPDYYDALVQLALLKEREGEHLEAYRMKQRAGKLIAAEVAPNGKEF
jgi:chemotaxis protein methyltransferase WspC